MVLSITFQEEVSPSEPVIPNNICLIQSMIDQNISLGNASIVCPPNCMNLPPAKCKQPINYVCHPRDGTWMASSLRGSKPTISNPPWSWLSSSVFWAIQSSRYFTSQRLPPWISSPASTISYSFRIFIILISYIWITYWISFQCSLCVVSINLPKSLTICLS